jgi:hypothetical protein
MDTHSDTAAANGPKSADRARIVEASPGSRVRSRLTNHKDLLPNLDGRSAAARRFRDLVKSLVIDQGGFSKCSEVKLGLLRRLAAVTVQSELLEAKMVNGEAIDIGTLCMLASTTVRISQRLGLNRVAKDATPSLATYLRSPPPTEIEEAAE